MTRPSIEAERLQTVQLAARYLLAEDGLGHESFGTMDIFPPSSGHPRAGTPEYAWRAQLAWTWTRAAFLDRKMVGRGIGKHWSYRLLPAGREALALIAEDPVIASFYVKSKRAATSDSPDWYRPPQLTVLTAATDDGDNVGASVVGSGYVPGAYDAVDDGDAEEGFEGKDAVESDGGDAVSPELGALGAYFERATAVLEVISSRVEAIGVRIEVIGARAEAVDARVGATEREISAQSDLVLEVSQKLDRVGTEAASSADVARAAGEIVAAVSKLRGHSADAEAAEAEAAAQAVVSRVVGALAPLIQLSVTQAATQAASSAVATIEEGRSAIFDKIDSIAAAAPDLGVLGALASDLRQELGAVRSDLEDLAATSGVLSEKFDEQALLFRQQLQTIQDTAIRVAEAARELLDAAGVVSKEIIGIASAKGRDLPPDVMLARGEEAINRMEAQGARVRGSVSSLGGGLIRRPDAANPGSHGGDER